MQFTQNPGALHAPANFKGSKVQTTGASPGLHWALSQSTWSVFSGARLKSQLKTALSPCVICNFGQPKTGPCLRGIFSATFNLAGEFVDEMEAKGYHFRAVPEATDFRYKGVEARKNRPE